MIFNKICLFFLTCLVATVISAYLPEELPKIGSESTSNVASTTVAFNASSPPAPTVSEENSSTDSEDDEDEDEDDDEEEDVKDIVVGDGASDMVTLIAGIVKDEMEKEIPNGEQTEKSVGTTGSAVSEDHGRYDRHKFRRIAGKILGRLLTSTVLPAVLG